MNGIKGNKCQKKIWIYEKKAVILHIVLKDK